MPRRWASRSSSPTPTSETSTPTLTGAFPVVTHCLVQLTSHETGSERCSLPTVRPGAGGLAGCRVAGLGRPGGGIGGSGGGRTREGCSHLGSRFGGDRPHNRRNPDGRFRLLVGLRCRLRNHARLCGHIRLRLGRLGGGSESREPGVGLLGPDLHLGNPGLHLLDPGLGLLDLLEPLAQVNLLAQQQADGSSCQQPGQSAG